jgi:hypothetical protein
MQGRLALPRFVRSSDSAGEMRSGRTHHAAARADEWVGNTPPRPGRKCRVTPGREVNRDASRRPHSAGEGASTPSLRLGGPRKSYSASCRSGNCAILRLLRHTTHDRPVVGLLGSQRWVQMPRRALHRCHRSVLNEAATRRGSHAAREVQFRRVLTAQPPTARTGRGGSAWERCRRRPQRIANGV